MNRVDTRMVDEQSGYKNGGYTECISGMVDEQSGYKSG